MKNFVFIALVFLTAMIGSVNRASAQQTLNVTATTKNAGGISSTLTNVDTAWAVVPVESATTSVTVYDYKVNGTIAGKWYLQGTVKPGKWDKLDSLTRSNSDNQKTFAFPAIKPYVQYRLMGIQANGSSTSTFEIKTVRRN